MTANRATSEVAIALVEREGRWLVSRRLKPDGFAGLWEFPGGKIEDGETPQAAAARECQEELGIVVEVGDVLPVVDHDYGAVRVRLHLVRCRWVAGQPRCREATSADPRWVDLDELARLPMPAANAVVIEQLRASLAATAAINRTRGAGRDSRA